MRPGTYLAEDQQALLLFLTGGQGGKLLQLQWCRRRGDVQVVLEGLEDGAGRQAMLIGPVTDNPCRGTTEVRDGWGKDSVGPKGLGPSLGGQTCFWSRGWGLKNQVLQSQLTPWLATSIPHLQPGFLGTL